MFRTEGHNTRSRGIAIAGVIVAIGVGLFTSRSARAVIVVPGDIGPTAVTPTALGGGFPGGLPPGDVLVAQETMPFVGKNSSNVTVFEGSVTSYVFSDPADPVFGGQPGYDFVYQLTNEVDNLTPDDPIDRVTFSSFANFLTDVDYLTGTGDVAPTTADRSSDAPGKIIGFNFPVGGAVVSPGQTSDYLVVLTNSGTYTQGTASVIDGGTGTTGAEAPAATVIFTVPEPATFGVIAVVGGMLLGRRRRS